MGIDYTVIEIILNSFKYVKNFDNVLTLGRQGIHISKDIFNNQLNKYNYNLNDNAFDTYCENFFINIGFKNVDSIDYSSYENATIIHDMNKPVDKLLYNKFQYILDGGTIEHIFNTTQVIDNIINLLDIGGIFCSIACNNNFSGHGIYQFSPEFFMSAFTKTYGMEIIDMYLAEVNTSIEDWIHLDPLNNFENGRNEIKFNSTKAVYILTIAKKISNNIVSVLDITPQQYSYNQMDWIKHIN